MDEANCQLVDNDELLEWAKFMIICMVLPDSLLRRAGPGTGCNAEIDIQGAFQIKARKPDGVFIFIAPTSKNCPYGWKNVEKIHRKV